MPRAKKGSDMVIEATAAAEPSPSAIGVPSLERNAQLSAALAGYAEQLNSFSE